MPTRKRTEPPQQPDEPTVNRLRAALPTKGVLEQRMFGGIGFMLDGNLVCGTSKRGVLLRVGKEGHKDVLARGAKPMEMRGRKLEGYVFVDPASLDDAALRRWINTAAAHVRTLPPKSKTAAKKPGRARRA